MADKASVVGSILSMKCPNCRKGSMYEQKGIFPMKNLLKMPEKCEECGQPMEIEPGFYYGTGYVSYALSIALTVFNFCWYFVFLGISFRDNSIYQYLMVNLAIVILMQPILMRYSRVLYLYMFVQYDSLKDKQAEEAAALERHNQTTSPAE